MRSYPAGSATVSVLRLDPGEEVLAAIASFVQEQRILAASLSGIGAVRNVTLGYFDLHRRAYSKREIAGDLELVSLAGNVTWSDELPVVHAHVVLSGPDFGAVGGHLFSAEIAVTGEITLLQLPQRIERARDEATGLKLIGDPPGCAR